MTFRVEEDSDIIENIHEKTYSGNQAKVRDSGKSVSTATHHFSVSSSDRKKL